MHLFKITFGNNPLNKILVGKFPNVLKIVQYQNLSSIVLLMIVIVDSASLLILLLVNDRFFSSIIAV